MENDLNDVGQDKTYKEAVEKYDSQHGTYKPNVPRDGGDPNTAVGPSAPDPSPFKLGQQG